MSEFGFRMLGSCWRLTTWWREFAATPRFCRHLRAQHSEDFGKQVRGTGACEVNVEDSPATCLIASQWVWSSLLPVHPPHLNDESICQTASCFRFVVLDLAPISIPWTQRCGDCSRVLVRLPIQIAMLKFHVTILSIAPLNVYTELNYKCREQSQWPLN